MSGSLGDAGPSDERPPFRFVVHFRADIADTDLTGVVYYARFAHFCDRAVIAYRRYLGLSPLGPAGHHLVVRAMSAEFLAPAPFDARLAVYVRAQALGRTSHRIGFRVEADRANDPLHLADLAQTFVGLDGYGGRPSPIPPRMRVAIADFEGGELAGDG